MTTTDEKGMFDFDLDAFKAKRDDAQSKELRWEATSFEIKQAYEAGERNLEGANLYDANLEGANLYGANLEGANLYGANLEGANLKYANLEGANLKYANLEGANLYGANLEGANLRCANLYGANLYGANPYGANLKYANLEGANLYGANLEGANLYGANLYGANLEGANGIYSAYAPNLSSRGATLTGGVIVKDGKIQLRFWAGCKQRMTDKKLLEYVKKTHDDNIHAKQYKAAINFIKACFKADMAANKWDYLLTWKPVELVKGK